MLGRFSFRNRTWEYATSSTCPSSAPAAVTTRWASPGTTFLGPSAPPHAPEVWRRWKPSPMLSLLSSLLESLRPWFKSLTQSCFTCRWSLQSGFRPRFACTLTTRASPTLMGGASRWVSSSVLQLGGYSIVRGAGNKVTSSKEHVSTKQPTTPQGKIVFIRLHVIFGTHWISVNNMTTPYIQQ